MSVIAARVDYRLLHGIVATQWSPNYAPQRIMIIDDKTAGDPILKEGMKMGRPAGVAISIISEETALNNFKAGKYNGQRVFILTEKPDVLLKIAELGEEMGEVIIGLTREVNSGLQLSNRAAIQDSEMDAYKGLLEKNIPVYCQYIPADKKIPLKNFL